MGNENNKEHGESSPNALSIASESADDDTDSRPPSTTASIESAEQEDQPSIRKSRRKRIAKRLESPSPPPQRARKASKAPPKKGSTKPPPKKIARAEPPRHVLMSHPIPTRTKQPARLKLPPSPEPSPSTKDFFVDSEDEEDTRSDSSSLMSDDPSDFPWDPAGIYAPLLRLRQQRHSNCIPVIPLPSRTTGGVRDQLEKTKVCNCKRSNCLKLYCDCFMAGLYCASDCKCIDCKNNSDNARDRNIAIDLTLLRNPNAFRPRPATEPASTSNPRRAGGEKGCNCKKSSCLKKYCECFLDCVYCSTLCHCVECKNKVGNKEREALMAGRRRYAKAAAEQAQLQASREVRTSQARGGEAMSTAAAVRAATVAKGVDLFLPPSRHSKPMTLENNKKYPMVAFTKVVSQNGVSSTKSSAKKKKSSIPKMKPKLPPHNDKYKYETDLEKLWRVETDRVELTFEKAYSDVQNELSSSKYSVRDGPSKTNRDPMIDYRARMTVGNVMEDIKNIVAAVNKAETSAVKLLDEKKEEVNEISSSGQARSVAGPFSSSPMLACPHDESALLCTENIMGSDGDNDDGIGFVDDSLLCREKIDDSEDLELTGDAVRELTVLAAQEAALIRQLTDIVRRKTLALTNQRLRLIENARKKV